MIGARVCSRGVESDERGEGRSRPVYGACGLGFMEIRELGSNRLVEDEGI